MQVFKLVEVSECCLLFEAAEWIALGRVPSIWYSEDADEMRCNIRSLMDEYSAYSLPYSEAEFESLGIDLDYEEYFNSIILNVPSSFEEFFEVKYIEIEWAGKFIGPLKPDNIDAIEANIAANEAVRPHIEIAQMKVLLALMDGTLPAYGYSLPSEWIEHNNWWLNVDRSEVTHAEVVEQAKIVQIPKEVWANDSEIWEYGCGEENLPGFVGLWVMVADLLRLFPKPDCGTTEVMGNKSGDTIIVETSGQVSAKIPLRGRGRPKRADGLIERAVKNEFTRRVKAYGVPKKREAFLQECIEWVSDTFEEKISRSAAQRYLLGIGDAQKDAH